MIGVPPKVLAALKAQKRRCNEIARRHAAARSPGVHPRIMAARKAGAKI